MGKTKGNFRGGKLQNISLFKINLSLKILLYIKKGVVAMFCSISFSNCKVYKLKRTAYSQMFDYVYL